MVSSNLISNTLPRSENTALNDSKLSIGSTTTTLIPWNISLAMLCIGLGIVPDSASALSVMLQTFSTYSRNDLKAYLLVLIIRDYN